MPNRSLFGDNVPSDRRFVTLPSKTWTRIQSYCESNNVHASHFMDNAVDMRFKRPDIARLYAVIEAQKTEIQALMEAARNKSLIREVERLRLERSEAVQAYANLRRSLSSTLQRSETAKRHFVSLMQRLEAPRKEQLDVDAVLQRAAGVKHE